MNKVKPTSPANNLNGTTNNVVDTITKYLHTTHLNVIDFFAWGGGIFYVGV
jgi:hypothetical protein